MTKEEWAQVEEQLKHQLNPVTLLCDGYRLQLQLSRIAAMSLGITFYVDGWMRGEWFFDDCEERQRFFRPMTHLIYGVKSRRAYRGISAKSLKEYGIDLEKTSTSFSFYWTSFRALRAHLNKHNKSILLVPLETAEIRGIMR